MKKAPPVRLSLRKLFIAMLAVGPISILPSPLLAVVPQGSSASVPPVQPFTVLNGTATWNGSGTLGTVNASDRAIVSWNGGAFNIATGEIFSFLVPSGGSILNKVGYGTNGATLTSPDNAVINGTITSTGRVFVLANGSINVGAGAVINTANGLFLSTLQETDNFTFSTSGNLAFTGPSAGTITIGGAGSQVSVAGSLGAWGGTVAPNNLSVSGDLIINQKDTVAALALTGAGGLVSVGGNLTATSNNTAITQGASALSVGPVATFNTTAGVTLTNVANNFNIVTANAGSVSLADSNSIILGASTITGGLSVTAVNDISTNGTLVVGGSVNLVSSGVGNITFGNNTSTVAGTFSASAANGNISVSTAGNLTLGALTGATGAGLALGTIAVTSGGTGYTAAPTVSITGGGGTGATATATVLGGAVTGVTITNVGSGYTGAPVISFTGGGTNPLAAAIATAVLAADAVGSVTVTSPGTGYTAVPTVAFSGPGTGATATAAIAGGGVSAVNVGAGGSGYTSAPTITFAGGGTNPTTAALAPSLSLLSPSTITVATAGTATIGGPVSGGTVSFTGASITSNATGTISAGGLVTFNATAGSVVLPGVTSANRLAVTATGGSISQAAGTTLATTANTTSTFNAGSTGTITLTNANVMDKAIVQLTGSTVSINNTRDLTVGGSTIGGSLTINTTAAPITTGNVTLGAGFGTAAQDVNIGGALTVSTNNAFITEDPATITNVFGSVTLNTLPAGTFPGTVLGVSLQGGGIGYTGTPTITFSGPGGGGTTATGTAVMGSGATAGQIVGINITNIGSGYTTVPTITFSTTGSFASASAVANTGGRVSFTAASSSVTGGGRYGQFNVTSSFIDLNENTALNLGSITGQTVSVNSTASDVLINGTLTAGALTARASSGSIIESGSGVVLIGGTSSFNSSNSFGTNLSNTGNVFGGAVNVRNGLTNVIVSGSALTLAGGTCVTAGNSTLTVSTVGAANTLRTNGEVSRLIGTSAGSIIIDGGNHSTILNLTANDPGISSITQSGAVRSDGTLTLASAGNTTLSQVSNNITNVVLNNTVGDTLVFSARNLTLSGSANGNVTAAAGTAVAGASTNTFSNPWNVVLGNLNVRQNLNVGAFNGNTTVAPVTSINVTNGGTGYTAAPTVTVTGGSGVGATATALVAGGLVTSVIITSPGSGFVTAPTVTFGAVTGASGAAAAAVVPGPIGLTGTATGGNAIAGSSGNITQQTGTRTHVESTMDLVTFNGNIVLANNGNNFGRVQASTGGGTGLGGTGDITIVEDASMKVGLIATTGNVSLTSRFGSVVEDSVNNVIITANGTSSVLNLAAPSGSVQLGGLTRTSGTTTGNVSAVNITVSGSAQLATTGNLTLGPTSANSLAVTANNISQSGALNIFGTSSFNATNSINLTNSANNFGPLTLISQTTNQNIAVTEGSTLNLRSVTMPGGGNGTFTATSANGDIIDTGLGGVRLGGAVVLNTPVVGTGVVTLAATNGNIILDDPTSDVLSTSGIVFNSQNVTISVLGSLGSTLVLGASGVPSVVSGNLTASSALGNIGNAGPLTVGGTASFQTGNGNITIAQSGVGFGSVRFVGNQVSISEGGNMDILTGSTAFGPANLVSGGSITIVDAGSNQNVTFGNTVNMSATGNITLRLLQAVGQLAATASGTKDLSALSLSTDLNGKTPIFGGSGANIDPKP